MGVSRLVLGGEVKFDLTQDTVTADKVLYGFTFHGADGEAGTGTCTYDVDSSDGTVTVAEMLTGKTAYARGVKLTGTMPNRGAVTGSISTKAGTYTIPQGYHDGSGTVAIDSTEQSKIIATNIREGVSILGVTGTMSGTEDVTAESVTVTPSMSAQVVTPSEGYNYISQVTVNAIPYTETENSAGGTTITIG